MSGASKGLTVLPNGTRELDVVLSDEHHALVRELGKIERRLFTDAIQAFVKYVDLDGIGSSRPDLAYRNMTAMVYSAADLNVLQKRAKDHGKNVRDVISRIELKFLQFAEEAAAIAIWFGIENKWTRKNIKREVKACSLRVANMMRPFTNPEDFLKKDGENESE